MGSRHRGAYWKKETPLWKSQLAGCPRKHVVLDVIGADVRRRRQNLLELNATNIFDLLRGKLSADKVTDKNHTASSYAMSVGFAAI